MSFDVLSTAWLVSAIEMSRRHSSEIVILCIACVCGFGCEGQPTSARSETRKRGNVIVTALNRYKDDHGKWPTSLGALKPAYLSKIPKPTWGTQHWNYSVVDREDAQGFVLSVHANDSEYPSMYYSNKDKAWIYDH